MIQTKEQNNGGRNYKHLRISGKTVDGKPVLSGWFPLVSSEGIPLDVVIEQIYQLGYVPDFYYFLIEAKKSGWNKNSTKTKLETIISDLSWTKEQKEEFNKRLDKVIMGM